MKRFARRSICVNYNRSPEGASQAASPAILYAPAETRARTALERAERREANAFVAAALAAPVDLVAAALARC